MTYCFGFKYKQSVYLFADSVVTHGGNARTSQTTSFGEASIRRDDGLISEEETLKIDFLGNDCIVAMAGNVNEAITFLRYLKSQYASSTSFEQILTLLKKYRSHSHYTGFEYLIARISAKGPTLWYWKSSTPENMNEVATFQDMGSLKSWHKEFTKNLHHWLTKLNLTEDHALTVITALVQSYGVRDYILEQGVGGIFYGYRLCSEEIQILPPTNYVIYGPQVLRAEVVSAHFALGSLGLVSSFSGNARVLASPLMERENHARWMQDWTDYFHSTMKFLAASTWVFLSRNHFNVTIIDNDSITTEIPCFSIKTNDCINFEIAFHSIFAQALQIPVQDTGDGSMPVGLSYNIASECLGHASWIIREYVAGTFDHPLHR